MIIFYRYLDTHFYKLLIVNGNIQNTKKIILIFPLSLINENS